MSVLPFAMQAGEGQDVSMAEVVDLSGDSPSAGKQGSYSQDQYSRLQVSQDRVAGTSALLEQGSRHSFLKHEHVHY
jgi:hypothetical protein